MKKTTKFLATFLVLVVLLIPTSVLLSKFVFTTTYSYACVVNKTSQGVLSGDKRAITLKIESVKYPWGHGYDLLRLEDELYASYDPRQTLTIVGKDVFASQNQNNRLKTVSFDSQSGSLIFQEIFQTNNGQSYKDIYQGDCNLQKSFI